MNERPKKHPRFSAAARARLARTLGAAPRIERRADRSGPWPLTSGQERLYLAEEVLGPSPLYHVPLAAHLVGPLDPRALEQALGALLARHELLRGTFARAGESLVQTITDGLGFRLARHALQGGTPAGNFAHALELARAEFRRPFDLARELPLRASLWSLGPDEHLLLVTVHHLVCDGITIRVLCEELAEHYAAERSHHPLSLIEPELQHGDYATWQRARAADEDVRYAVTHVAARLADAPAPLDLPTDHPRPTRWTARGAWRSRRVGEELATSLVSLAQAHGATPFQLFLAACQALLFRWTRQEDLVVGVPATLRDPPELERLPGFLVNTLPVRTRVEGSQSFVELLARTRDSALDAFGHKEAPFERVLEVLRPAHDPGRTPLFQVMFDHRAGLAHALALEGLVSGRLLGEDELHSGTSKVDLALYTELGENGLVLSAEYRADLFEEATIERLLGRLEVLLAGLAAHPHARLDELPWLGAEERALVGETWARGPRVAGCESTIQAAFAEVATRLGDKVALEHGAERVTYAALLMRARRIARRLVELGVTRGEPVALCLPRSSDLVAAELAILEAGGAYLPLDRNYPEERLRFMLRDSGARVLIGVTESLAGLPHEGLRVLDLTAERTALDTLTPLEPQEHSGPAEPAYLIYTSGSTGVPKGVACPHRGVLRLFREARWLDFDERVRMVHLAPESFDASILDLWGPLLGGGTLVLHPEKTPTLAGLARVVAEHRIDTLFLTTALFHALVDEAPETLARLRQVATGGEALSLAHVERARRAAPTLALANCYGPTEATVIATTWRVPAPLPPELTVAPIGTPVTNTDVLVLDARGEPTPIGVAGELHVGGDSIALGYWKRPELTAERFVRDPRGPGRLYRTGDLARWRTDGQLEFLGRGDDQVKIRGHRIELAEIESRLGEHPSVRQALVIAASGSDGAKRLVAYAVPGDSRPSLDELRTHLAARLPEYMRPAALVLLDELPVTPGGKIDRARLPQPVAENAAGTRTPPRGPTEESLARLWRELLGLGQVAREDEFFALGGHSLTATVLCARVAREFGLELPLATLFEARTLAALARAVEELRAPSKSTPVPPRPPTADGPLSSNQRGLWFLQELAPGNAFYNVPFAVPLAGPLVPAALAQALAEIVRRHEALRTVYPLVGGEPMARVTAAEHELGTLDLTALAPAVREPRKAAALADFARRPFDLARGPLFRTLLVREEPERATLAVAVHHIAFDGWSFDVFVAELAALYASAVRGVPATLAAPASQYADHAWRQRHELTPERRAAELAFWKQELDGAPLVLELPTDHPRPATPSWRGAKVTRALPAALVAAIEALARAEGATPFLVTLAVAEVLLARHSGVEDLVLGTPAAGRSRAESERSIGLYLNVLALRADLRGRPSFRELLARTRARLLAAHAHQDFPFENLVEALAVERDPAVTPVYQVLFSLRQAARATQAGGLTLAPAIELDSASAKTDLALTLEQRPGDWLLDLTFAADLFDGPTMERFAERFETLLASALEAPGACVFELELCPPAERERLARLSGATPAYPRDEGLATLFERAVQRMPAALAVSLEGKTLTYAALNARANRLARELATLGVTRGSRVGLCVDRSLELPVALLAILKAGGAYVPLDPSYPSERLELMLTDAGVEVLLVDEHLASELPETGARRVVLGSLGDLAQHADTDLAPAAGGEDLAYVMYTSGSTGRPKGVEIPQRAIARLVFGASYATFDATRVWLQLAPISFDASTLEIWGALLHGGRLALYPERVPTAEDLERVLRAEEVTSLWLTAALFNAIVDERPTALAGVSECLTGGEALSVAHVRRAYAALPPTVTLINGYGPTENTTFTCCYRIPRELPADTTSIPIGQPIENTSVFVVDHALRPVPIGVAGELVTGGDGLARGYRGRPELDAERFVTSPLDGRRLYRTGDRVRWLADGRLEFLGRNDDQVKIRGHRIEPGEIAVVLGTHARVRKAFVAVHEAPASGKTLVAYFEAREGAPPTTSELASWLAERIPSYMVPSAFVPMEALPMNANGKVDRKQLPEPVFETRSTAGPRNDMEGLLASLWQSVLKVERVGPDDDFFELGGHSLLAVKLVQAIKDAFGQELELASLVSTPTLAEMALSLHHGIGTARSSALVKLQPEGNETPVFCVCSLGGTVLNQRPLAVRLTDRPFYGLQAIELDSKLGRPASIEDYAAAYIEAMKKVQPRGPYIVGGHSFGGIVSFEIAQQLQKGGDEVEMLFILDSSLPNLDKGALDRLACIFAFLRGLPYLPAETLQQIKSDPEHLTRALKQKLRFVARKTGLASAPKPAQGPRPLASAPPDEPGSMRVADVVEMTHWPENNRRIAQRHWRAVQDYRPQAYPGRITLFRSRFQSPFLGLGSEMGWDRVAKGGVEVVRVPGGHLSVLQPPNVDVLARRFLERLRRRRRAA